MLVNQNGPSEAKGVFDLTNLYYTQTLSALNKQLFVPANRRGSPSRIEGLGSSNDGVWGRVPQWVWAKSKVLFLPREMWLGKAEKRRRPLSILMRKRQNTYRVTSIETISSPC